MDPLQDGAVAPATDCDLRRILVLNSRHAALSGLTLLQRSLRENKKNMSTALASILSTRLTILEELVPAPRIAHTRVHFRALPGGQRPVQFAVLSSSHFRRELESEIETRGFDGIAVREPSDLEIAELQDFHLVPEWIRWVMPSPASGSAWIESLPGSDLRSQMRRKLRASVGVRVETAPLTLSDYNAWHSQLYVPEIMSKSGAIPSWPPVAGLGGKLNLPLPLEADSTVVPGLLRMFMFDEHERLIGGALLSVDAADKTLRLRAAAYEAVSRSARELSVRGIHEMIEVARAHGAAYLSSGDDPNLYGVDVTLGLARFKISIGMQPVPSTVGGFQLIRIFDDAHERLDAEAAGLFCFGVASRGAGRIGSLIRLGSLARANLPYQQKIELTRADMAGLQIGGAPTASAARVPKGMPLIRFDRAVYREEEVTVCG